MYEYAAALVSIHDGDTMRFNVDLGFSLHQVNMDLRLYGLNAPELGTDAGRAALKFVQDWFTANPGPYVLKTQKDRQEKYGRYLATIYAGAKCLNDDLLSSGNAVPYMV